ncbi:tetratricopeptide repeat protein [Candidatus Uhrbacteria bacterium]|nr:tetratricopeptide repeat protein [Candidatus Uhrbacteria bacterium]
MFSREKFLKLFFYGGVSILVLIAIAMFTPKSEPTFPPLESFGSQLDPARRQVLLDRIKQYQDKASANPTDADPWLQMGINQTELGALPWAIKSYQKAGELAPGSFLSFYNLGELYVRTGQYDKAEIAYATAIKADPVRTNLYRPLVQLYQQYLPEKKEKIPQLLNAGLALTENSNSVELLSLLGSYYVSVGDRENSIKAYERLAEIFPNNSAAKEQLDKLKAQQ